MGGLFSIEESSLLILGSLLLREGFGRGLLGDPLLLEESSLLILSGFLLLEGFGRRGLGGLLLLKDAARFFARLTTFVTGTLHCFESSLLALARSIPLSAQLFQNRVFCHFAPPNCQELSKSVDEVRHL